MIQEPKSLFVIAAFEANSTHPPKNLEDLVKAVKKGKVSPVRMIFLQVFVLIHRPQKNFSFPRSYRLQ